MCQMLSSLDAIRMHTLQEQTYEILLLLTFKLYTKIYGSIMRFSCLITATL
jgi:hypothetical protein